ncbi:hypothetical protein ACRQ5D_22235 [Mucilaginibacter sp. P25]|uniref:Uncharacterized protein n=1 Tax=Mucilaginibacter gossypii TaxID=551996 RepID=A0A1G8N5T7_9SPHI|nr:hypothetical protein SAMN05192573_13123 [Mucilaginibacter gossypii]
MTIIANELHVNAVRIEGEETSLLVVATKLLTEPAYMVFLIPERCMRVPMNNFVHE